MKNINCKKYDRIRKLLESTSIDDVVIGLTILGTEFNTDDFLYNFPNHSSPRDFHANISEERFYILLGDVIIHIDSFIFTVRNNKDNLELANNIAKYYYYGTNI